MWELVICIGVSWAGCGAGRVELYRTEESCYRALATMKTGDSPTAESDRKRNTVAYYRPAREK